MAFVLFCASVCCCDYYKDLRISPPNSEMYNSYQHSRHIGKIYLHVHACTCDGVMGEGLYIRQVVVRTVLLKPLADVLLSPQHYGFGQTGQCRTGVIHCQCFTRAQLKHKRSGNLSIKQSPQVCVCVCMWGVTILELLTL